MGGGDDSAVGFPPAAYKYILLMSCLSCVSQYSTPVLSERYHVVITASTRMKGMARQLTWVGCREMTLVGGSLRAGGRCGPIHCMGLVSVHR